ncbi:DedA family protein [Porphyromonas sp. COT-239 OH1446]|uniref:DedA family protein n=1 Tax=Porphyromonas sp. COT-239 OH1446 TaxID=1515613 RepID=UPI00052E1F89|nr:DedA family protein [Porphyromonas sp. COT-239 OH1446]KGN69923.1 membrane protein [Porphyromonas sp. COT-239 OH1446]
MESLEFIQEILRHLDYFWVTVLMAIESSFIPFPSEIVIPPAAWRAANGELNVLLVVLFATIGCNIGALVNYYLAKYLGRPVVYRFAESRVGRLCLLSREKVERAEAYFQKNGAISTLVGRLIPGIRQLISIPAGMAGMPLGPFLLYTTIGAGAWNVVLAALGYFLGANQELLIAYSKTIGLSIAGIVVVILIGLYFVKRRRTSLQK